MSCPHAGTAHRVLLTEWDSTPRCSISCPPRGQFLSTSCAFETTIFVRLTPESVAWAHHWISDPTLAAVFQTLPRANFIVNGATLAKNSALTSAGAELRFANGVTLLAKFDGEFASHSSTYAGAGTVRYTW